jgi:hypothetical protein
MKYIINPFATVIGWTGIAMLAVGEFLMYLSDGIKR